MRTLFFKIVLLATWTLAPCWANTYVKSMYALPITLDPIQMNDTASLAIGNLIYDGLLKFSPSLEIQEALAESWMTSNDGKTLTFKLRPNLKFHDGSSITADDVIYSLTRAISPESKMRKYYDCIEGADEVSGKINQDKIGIKALNANTVVVKLKKPFPAFISVLAGTTAKILPKKYKDDKNFFNAPIGSGLFRYKSKNVANKKIFLEAFESYYLGKSKIDQFVLLETTEELAIDKAKKNEVHDLVSWPLTASNLVFKYGKNVQSPLAATWIVGLNTKRPPFNSLKFRRDFKNSFNNEEFRKKFYPDAYPAFGYIPPGLPGYREKIDDKLEKKHNEKINPINQQIVIVIPQELSEAKEIKTYFEQSLKKQGWNVKVQLMAWDKLMDGYSKKKHQAFLVSMNMDYPDAEFLIRNFESNNPDNFSGLSNKTLDTLIYNSRVEANKSKRIEIYKNAIQILDESSVTVNLFHPKANYWVSNCVSGIKPSILSEVYVDYTQATIDENCINKGRKNE